LTAYWKTLPPRFVIKARTEFKSVHCTKQSIDFDFWAKNEGQWPLASHLLDNLLLIKKNDKPATTFSNTSIQRTSAPFFLGERDLCDPDARLLPADKCNSGLKTEDPQKQAVPGFGSDCSMHRGV